MFKKILVTILTVFLLNQAKAQPSQYTPMTANGYQMKRVKVDSTLHIPSFCGGQPSLNGSTSSMGALAFDTCFNRLYKYNTEFGWTEVGSTDFIDTIFRSNDSVFAKKNGIAFFQYKDSTGGSATTPTLQQVLTAGSTLTTNNTITGTTRTTISQTGTSTKKSEILFDTTQSTFGVTGLTNTSSILTLTNSSSQLQTSQTLTAGALVTTPNSSYLRYSKVFPSLNYNFGISEQGAYWLNGSNQYYFPTTAGTTGQILKLTSPSQLAWANDSSGGSSVDTTSLSNRINSKIDSLKRSTDSVFAYKNGMAYFQYKDSVSNTSGFVPYTGANQDVDLGMQKISSQSVYVTGTNGNGHIHLKHQNADATATGQSTSLYADNNGDIKWKNDGNFYTTLKTSGNAANAVYTFPSATTTLLGASDTTSLSSRIDARVKYTDTASMLTPYLRKTDTSSLSNRINTKLNITDTTVFARKQMPAYSFQANGTNAAANSTAVYFKDTSGTYTSSPTWNGTAPTSGNLSYRWTRIGRMVNLHIALVYSVAGTTNSTLTVPLPSDCPNPVDPAGLTSNLSFMYNAQLKIFATTTALASVTERVALRKNSGGTGYEVNAAFSGTNVVSALITVTYWTN